MSWSQNALPDNQKFPFSTFQPAQFCTTATCRCCHAHIRPLLTTSSTGSSISLSLGYWYLGSYSVAAAVCLTAFENVAAMGVASRPGSRVGSQRHARPFKERRRPRHLRNNRQMIDPPKSTPLHSKRLFMVDLFLLMFVSSLSW